MGRPDWNRPAQGMGVPLGGQQRREPVWTQPPPRVSEPQGRTEVYQQDWTQPPPRVSEPQGRPGVSQQDWSQPPPRSNERTNRPLIDLPVWNNPPPNMNEQSQGIPSGQTTWRQTTQANTHQRQYGNYQQNPPQGHGNQWDRSAQSQSRQDPQSRGHLRDDARAAIARIMSETNFPLGWEYTSSRACYVKPSEIHYNRI